MNQPLSYGFYWIITDLNLTFHKNWFSICVYTMQQMSAHDPNWPHHQSCWSHVHMPSPTYHIHAMQVSTSLAELVNDFIPWMRIHDHVGHEENAAVWHTMLWKR
jgi:hypothetical protein